MAAGCHTSAASVKRLRYEKSRWLGGPEFVDVIHARCRAACSPCGFMLHPLAWRVISNSALRCAKYEGVFSLFEFNSITLKECLHPFMCRIARYLAPLFKFWLHVSPKLAHRIIVLCHKTLCRYPLMREKCFGGEHSRATKSGRVLIAKRLRREGLLLRSPQNIPRCAPA